MRGIVSDSPSLGKGDVPRVNVPAEQLPWSLWFGPGKQTGHPDIIRHSRKPPGTEVDPGLLPSIPTWVKNHEQDALLDRTLQATQILGWTRLEQLDDVIRRRIDFTQLKSLQRMLEGYNLEEWARTEYDPETSTTETLRGVGLRNSGDKATRGSKLKFIAKA